MPDLTAWVPLWEKCPELVPGGWTYGLTSWKGVAWHRAEDTQEWLVTEAEPIDIDAQIGRAVAWLAERGGVFSTNINDLWQVVYRGRTIVTDQPSPQDALVAACQFVLDATETRHD